MSIGHTSTLTSHSFINILLINKLASKSLVGKKVINIKLKSGKKWEILENNK